jgi:hypothetical protein
MKKFYTLLCLSLLIVCTISCQKTDVKVVEHEPMTVSLNLTGDFEVDVTQDPLTRAASTDDAYALNIYYDKEGDGSVNDIYAYGLFDNVADMTITLLSNHKYNIFCSLIKNAKNTIYYGQAFNNAYSGYAYPFQTNASNSTLIGNAFIIGTSTYFTGLGSGNTHIASTASPSTSNYVKYPKVNRFYGVTRGYTPVPNGTIDIYLKRVVFGAKFVVSGVQEGKLSLSAGEFYSATYSKDDAGTDTIYTFPNVSDVYSNDLPLVATISLNYDSNRGSLWDLSTSQSVQFKRNVMTTVNINLNPDLSGASLSITEEELSEENIIDLGLNTDGLIDTVVKPEN